MEQMLPYAQRCSQLPSGLAPKGIEKLFSTPLVLNQT